MSKDPDHPPSSTPGAAERFRNIPIRRSQWRSFRIGVGAVFAALLLAAGVCALLMWLSKDISGVLLIMLFGVILFGGFFGSIPWQRRYSRSLDGRKPGVSLAIGVVYVPVKKDSTFIFWTGQPIEVAFGWLEFVVGGGGGPTTKTRTVMSWATLSQAGQNVMLYAEDSVKEAQKAGWQKVISPSAGAPMIRLWAADLVEFVEFLRTGQ